MKSMIHTVICLALFLSCSQLSTNSTYERERSGPFRHGPMSTLIDIQFSSAQRAPIDMDSIRRGRSLYNTYCISCHGPYGRGDGIEGEIIKGTPKDLSKLSHKVEALRFFLVKTENANSMPGWRPFFTERNVVDLGHYIESLSR